MTTLQLEPDQKQAIETEISPALEKARSLVVRNSEERGLAVFFIKGLKEMKEKIENRFHPTANKKKAHEVYEDLLETEHAFYDPIDEAVKIANGTVKTFDTNEAIRVQREAQDAEAKRQEAERKEREKLESQAQKQEGKGNVERAANLREQAENVSVAPTFAPPPASVKKLIWKATCTNVFLLCKAIVTGKVPYTVLEVNVAQLNAFAKTYDGKTKIEGLEFKQESAGRI